MPAINTLNGLENQLTRYVEGVTPTGMIAPLVADPTRVPFKSGEYFAWNKDDAGRIPKTERAPGSSANVLDDELTTAGTYTATKRSLALRILQDEVDNNALPQLKESKIKRAKTKVMMDLEARLATVLTATGSYASSNQTTVAVKWDDAAFTGSIEKYIDDAKEAIRIQNYGQSEGAGYFIIIPSAVAKVIKRDDKVRELIKYTQSNLLVNGDLPPTMWGCQVIIPTVSYNPNLKGNSTQTKADIWGNSVIVGMKTAAEAIDEPSFVKIFTHQKYPSYDGFARSWTSEHNDFTQYVEYVTYNDVKVTSNVGGYLIPNVLS